MPGGVTFGRPPRPGAESGGTRVHGRGASRLDVVRLSGELRPIQLLVGFPFADPALVDDQDLVGFANGGEPVGDPAVLDAASAAQVAETFQALADTERLLILARLRREPASVTQLAADIGMEQSAVSHQLRLLLRARGGHRPV